ncbi:MAG: AI-2E family transporter [Christensenellales bacterium]
MSYLSGVLKTSLFVFLATFAGLFALGINDALLLSVFMSVFEVFPYIGPILASIPIALTALGQESAKLSLPNRRCDRSAD